MFATRLPALLVAAAVVATATLLYPSQPGYDGWAWLVWGRELTQLDLDTAEGPAFKPLPVAVASLLSLGGAVAPQLWLIIARSGALVAVALAGVTARRLSGGSRLAAGVAAGGVAVSAGFPWHAAVGNSEGLFLALALAAFERASAGRHRPALVLGLAAGLLRPEAWLFLGAYGLWCWLRRPELRVWLVAGSAALVALWFVPEWLGSGDPLRSSARARIPNPGAPALSDDPAWESLRAAAAIPLAPLLCALPLLALGRRRARMRAAVPALAGIAWVSVVAVMAELGYSGEARYALPGAALLAVPAGVAVAWGRDALPRGGLRLAVGVAVAVACVPLVLARADRLGGELGRAADDARLFGSLPEAIEDAGGATRLRGCGRSVVGRYRGTAAAWALGVHRREIAFDERLGDVVLRSRLRPDTPLTPAGDALAVLGRSERWEVRGDCPPGASARAAAPGR